MTKTVISSLSVTMSRKPTITKTSKFIRTFFPSLIFLSNLGKQQKNKSKTNYGKIFVAIKLERGGGG